jgi:3-phosphoshikimate 1-carboxyvinyltransferase
VPASTSVAIRELVLSALADGRSEVDLGSIDPGPDVRVAREAVSALGCEVSEADGIVSVRPIAGTPANAHVDVGVSAAVVPFAGALAATRDARTTIDGGESLAPDVAPLLRALASLGATVERTDLPAAIRGPLPGGSVDVPGRGSSQLASALLIAGARSGDGIQLRLPGAVVSEPFMEETIRALEQRGVRVDRSGRDGFAVRPQRISARKVVVPGDAGAAAYPGAAAAILGGRVTIENVDPHDRLGAQGDLRAFELLERMGCSVSRSFGGITVRREGRLYGLRESLADLPDAFPALAVVAACAETRSELLGLGRTRRLAADRVSAVAAGLRALGADVAEFADGIAIDPAPLHAGVVDSAGDDRVAMAFAVLGLALPGVEIEGTEAVAATFPGFFSLLADLSK